MRSKHVCKTQKLCQYLLQTFNYLFHKVFRSSFVLVLAVYFALSEGKKKPHIIIFLADDLVSDYKLVTIIQLSIFKTTGKWDGEAGLLRHLKAFQPRGE